VIPRANTFTRNERDMGKSEQESGLHAAEDAPASWPGQVDEPLTQGAISSTSSRLDRARRLAGRAWRRAVTELSSVGRETQRMGLESRSYLGRTIDGRGTAHVSLAHVYAATSDVCRAIALDLLSHADSEDDDVPVSLPEQALLLQEDLGQLAGTMRRAMADGRLDREELLAVLEDAQRLLGNANALCRDARKALDALPVSR
jgi:aminoglycoside/choline kinase family phosphotransferase